MGIYHIDLCMSGMERVSAQVLVSVGLSLWVVSCFPVRMCCPWGMLFVKGHWCYPRRIRVVCVVFSYFSLDLFGPSHERRLVSLLEWRVCKWPDFEPENTAIVES